jgi:hypothetical protein
MAVPSFSPTRVVYHSTYVLPATVLWADPIDETDPSSLRADASYDGLCYVQVIDSFGDGTYLARVAAAAECVGTAGYTIVLSEAQLACAVPLDCRAQVRLQAPHARWRRKQEAFLTEARRTAEQESVLVASALMA